MTIASIYDHKWYRRCQGPVKPIGISSYNEKKSKVQFPAEKRESFLDKDILSRLVQLDFDETNLVSKLLSNEPTDETLFYNALKELSADGISSSNRNKESADDADLQELFDLIATTNKKSNHLKGDLRICPPNPNITTNKSNEVASAKQFSLSGHRRGC